MDWVEQLNAAMDYIESHLREAVRYEDAARIAGCSACHFQRMFTYLAGIPLSEYIRRRRMSLAAEDLSQGEKILDVALRYGYSSPTAFNRAFQAFHGLPPSRARAGGESLRAYPPIRFHVTLSGGTDLSYRLQQLPAFRVLGFGAWLGQGIEENFQIAPRLWEKAAQRLPQLLELMDGKPKGVLGISACEEGEQWRYYIAVSSSQAAGKELEEVWIPACTWAVFSGSGPCPQAIQQLERRVVTEWLPGSGYEYADAPDIEVYYRPDPADAVFEVWLPVVKRDL